MTGTLRRVGALDQLRATGRRVGTLQKRARCTVADAGKRAGGALGRAGKSAATAPGRLLERLRPGAEPTGSAPSATPTGPSTTPGTETGRFAELADRIRDNPRVTVAIVGGALLVCAWIAWAVYVTSENGALAGLGVMIAWPAMVVALALISLPFIGGYLLFRRLSIDEGNPESGAEAPEPTDAEPADQDEAEGEGDSDGEASKQESEEEPEPQDEESDGDGEDAEAEEASDGEEGEDSEPEEAGRAELNRSAAHESAFGAHRRPPEDGRSPGAR